MGGSILRRAGGAGAAVVLIAVLVGLRLHGANVGAVAADGVTDWWLAQVAAAVAYGGTGAWLVRARPRLVIGWLLLGVGAVSAGTFVLLEYAVASLEAAATDGSALPLATPALWVANWLWVTAYLAVGAVLPLLLPDGRLPSPRWRPALLLSAAAVVATVTTAALTPYASWAVGLQRAGAVNPLGTDVAAHAVTVAATTALALAAVCVAFAGLLTRWRQAEPEIRQRLKWVLLGGLASVALFAGGLLLGPSFTALATLPLPAACLLAALRFGLWDVDAVLSRSLVFGGLTSCVVAAYVAWVGLFGGLLGARTGAPLVATALVAVAAEPLHRRLRAGVNRFVYGEAETPATVLARAGERLGAARDASAVSEQVLPEVVAAVARALRLPYVAVRLADGTLVSHGRAPAELVERLPLRYGGSDVGELVVGSRPGGLSRADGRLLSGLAGQAAVAAHSVQLARDLRRSREQAVTVRDEERRRVYRELHDGLGPSLAALALQVETARDLVAVDAGRAAELLDRVVPRLAGTVRDVRGVVHGLRPLVLDEVGLPGALEELCLRFSTTRTAVRLEVGALGALPAAVEVACYRIVAEALTNATRHADATTIVVTVRGGNPLSNGGAVMNVVVEDDGIGVDEAAPAGVGIASMRERAVEVGGEFRLSAVGEGRGTRVSARLPALPS